jgi:hypothetical protein
MMPLECARCIDVHGRPGCPALLEDLDGKPLCCWCADGVSCPIEQRRLRAAKKKSGGEPPPDANEGNSEKAANEPESEVKVPKTLEKDSKDAPKLCKRPGCETQLSPRNSVGLCQKHVRWTAPGERVASSAAPTNGHAHAHAPGNGSNGSAKGNGHAKANGSNGAAAVADFPELALDRVDHLIASIPAADKARIALAWLKGL